MLIVFQDSSKEALAQGLGIVTWYNDYRNEDYSHCVAREKAQEIMTCRDMNVPYVVIGTERQNNKILDTNVDLFALPKDTTLVLRCNSNAVMPQAIAPFPRWISEEEMQRVTSWPNYISQPEHFLKRFVMPVERELFGQIFHSGSLTFPLFIKTMEKSDFHRVIETPEEFQKHFVTVEHARQTHPQKSAALEGLYSDSIVLVDRKADWYCPYREQMIAGRLTLDTLEGGLIVSDVMDIQKASNHKGEYRGYFINGQLSSLSAYLDYDHTEVPEAVADFAFEFGQAHASLAKAFVADFCLTDQGPALVEMNEFGHSGRYIDNDTKTLYGDLLRHFGSLRVAMAPPLVKVPSKEMTPHPGEDDVAVDFGQPSELIFANDDALVAKKPPTASSYMAKFEKAQAAKQRETIASAPLTGTDLG